MGNCANCGKRLMGAVFFDVDERRRPCPDCGSLARALGRVASDHVGMTDSVSHTVVATAQVVELGSIPSEEAVGAPTIVRHPPAGPVNRPAAKSVERHLRWYTPTDEHKLWFAEVSDGAGQFLDGGVGNNLDDALLDVAEALQPRPDEL